MSQGIAWSKEIPLQEIGGGVSRRVLSYTLDMMVVEVRFPEGGIGAMHTHPHAQCCYVAEGTFRFTVEDREYTVSKGDSLTFECGVPHGVLCLSAGTLIDVFTPMREDFL